MNRRVVLVLMMMIGLYILDPVAENVQEDSPIDYTMVENDVVVNSTHDNSQMAGFWSDWWNGFTDKPPRGVKVPTNG